MKAYICLIAFALTSCDRKSQKPLVSETLVIDNGLRGLYSVSSIRGSFMAPERSSHYVLTTLEFEDGKLARCGSRIRDTTESLHGESSTAQFLWGKQDGKTRTALETSGSVIKADNDFWSSMTATTNFADGSGPEYQGYKVLGMAQSDTTRDGIGDTGFGEDLDHALKERKFVGVLVARFFSSHEEVESFSLELSSPKNATEQADSFNGE